VVYRHFEEFQVYLDGVGFSEPWERIFYAMHVHSHHRMIDEFENNFDDLLTETKEIFEKAITSRS
jgi:hypothetical protein